MVVLRRRAWPRLLGILLLAILAWCFVLQRFLPFPLHFGVFPTTESDPALRDILNSTLGFEKLFVVNLPDRTDRRDAISLSAAISNIDIEFVKGVYGKEIPEKAFPPGESRLLSAGIKGSWRSHMNAIESVIRRNLTTALILEDDADWDIRLRSSLQKFALATRFLTSRDEDPIHGLTPAKSKNPEDEDRSIHNQAKNPIPESLFTLPLSSIYKKSWKWGKSKDGRLGSPYGNPEDWDVLWIGHCGSGFPRVKKTKAHTSAPSLKNILLSLAGDPTVPIPRHIKSHPFGGVDPLADSHAPHTRIYHRASGGQLCTIAYAVSQRGARKILHEFSVKFWQDIFDSALGTWCTGTDAPDDEGYSEQEKGKGKRSKEGREQREKRRDAARKDDRVCLTSQPPIIAHHHPENGESDIGGLGGGFARAYETKHIRWSVRMNLARLARGLGWNGDGIIDQWPDD